jgi:hypothetical protein
MRHCRLISKSARTEETDLLSFRLFFNGDATFFTGPVIPLAPLMSPLELFVQIAGSASKHFGSKWRVIHWS